MAERAVEGEDAKAEDAKAEDAEAEDVPMVESIENLEDTTPVQESEEEPSDFDVAIMPLSHEVQLDPLGSGSEFCGWSEDEERPHELTFRLGAGNQQTNYHQDRLEMIPLLDPHHSTEALSEGMLPHMRGKPLQKALRERGLPTSGNKDVMI